MSLVVLAGLLTTAVIVAAKRSEPEAVLVPAKIPARPQSRR